MRIWRHCNNSCIRLSNWMRADLNVKCQPRLQLMGPDPSKGKKMLRLFVYIAITLFVASLFVALALMDGSVAVRLGTTSYEIRLAIAVLLLVVLAILIAFFFMGVGWVQSLPARFRLKKLAKKRDKGLQALRKGLVAAAIGDGDEALKQSSKASVLLDDEPVLTGLLAAQAAESKGDRALAERNYMQLLEQDETHLLACRGLTKSAVESGDKPRAIEQADAAFAKSGKADWAFESAFDLKVDQHHWVEALATLDEADRRGIIGKERARRRRAVLYAAQSFEAFTRDEFEHAGQLAQRAVKLAPTFTPAVVMSATIAKRKKKISRAANMIEKAWEQHPHPALVQVFRDLKVEGADTAQIARMKKLIAQNPEHRESKILQAQLFIREGEAVEALKIMQVLLMGGATARLCEIMANISRISGREEEVTQWMSKAATAPTEPDWSDLDPAGEAFDYTPRDWARLVQVYGDTASLIHPRLERRETTANAVMPEALLPAPTVAVADEQKPASSGDQEVEPAPFDSEVEEKNQLQDQDDLPSAEDSSPNADSILDAARGKIRSI